MGAWRGESQWSDWVVETLETVMSSGHTESVGPRQWPGSHQAWSADHWGPGVVSDNCDNCQADGGTCYVLHACVMCVVYTPHPITTLNCDV